MKEITASDCDRNAPEDGEGKKIISLQDIILNTNPHQFSFESYSSGRYVCPDSNPRTSPLSPVSSRVCVRVCVARSSRVARPCACSRLHPRPRPSLQRACHLCLCAVT